MSNDISIVKNVIDKPQHKVSVPNDISITQKQKYIGIAKNQEKVLIMKTIILDFKNLSVNFDSNLSYKEFELEEKMSIGDGHSNVI